MNPLIAGSLAGLTATLPMTALMQSLHRRLPAPERYPLPPRQITMKMAREVGVEQKMDETEKTTVTYAAHFSYGAAAGATYGLLADRLPGSPVTRGVTFGLAVWAVSYLGWLPAVQILPAATHEPARRNALMIAAHLTWGAATGVMMAALEDK
ncbi:MAG: DUF6789 family protein [Pirellulaceae bacterium]